MKKSFQKKLASVLAAVMLVSTVFPGTFPALKSAAASGTLAPERLTAQSNLRSSVNLSTAVSKCGSETRTSADGEGPGKLFDNDLGTKMGAHRNGTDTVVITWQMNAATKITAYTLATANDSPERDPKSWTLSGSNNGTDYTAISTVTGYIAPADRSVYYDNDFLIANPAEYTHYKLELTAFKGLGEGGYPQFSELVLSGADTSDILGVAALIDGIPVEEDAGFIDAVNEVESAYNGLSPYKQALVYNRNELAAAIRARDAALAPEEYQAAVRSVLELIAAIDDPVTHRTAKKIADARAAYDALPTEATQYVTNAAKLSAAESALQALYSAYSLTVTGWDTDSNFNHTPWMTLANTTEEQKNLTRTAMADEMKYQYVAKSYLVYKTTGSIGIDNWSSDTLGMQCETSESDNIGSPWSNTRYWAFVTAPFVGTAFSETGYLAASGHDGNPAALTDSFVYDGKVYQIYWNKTRFHNDIPLVKSATTAVTTVPLYPGSAASGELDLTNNTFRYAYALYNQTHKWENKVLGIPADNTKLASGVRYQSFYGPSGDSYIAGNDPYIKTVNGNSGRPLGAYVIAGNIVSAFKALGADDGARFAVTGAPIADAVTDGGVTSQTFEKGILAAGGFTPFDSDVAEAIQLIASLPVTERITLAWEQEIETAASAYGALSPEKQTQVINSAALTAAVDKIEELQSSVTLIDGLAKIEFESYVVSSGNGIKTETTSDVTVDGAPVSSIGNVGGSYANGWMGYQNINFGAAGVNVFSATIANNNNCKSDSAIEVRMGFPDGTLLGTAALTPFTAESGWKVYKTFTVHLNQTVTGVQDIYIVMRGTTPADKGTIANFDSYQFKSVNDSVIQPVIDLIDALPATEELMLENESAVVNARTQYTALPDLEKTFVTNYADLQAAEAKIVELKADAAAVVDLIAALPATADLTLSDKAAVEAAREAYDALSPAQQDLVANYTALQAAEAKIAELETVSITATAGPGGRAAGSGDYAAGSSVTLTATPNYGYQFSNWTVDGTPVSEDASYTFTAEEALTVQANFEPAIFGVTAAVNPAGGGSVSQEAGTAAYNQSYTVTATASEGYVFVSWTDADGRILSRDAAYTFRVLESINLTANFQSVTPETTVHTVVFLNSIGDVLSVQYVEDGHAAAEPARPSKPDCSFESWDAGFGDVRGDLVIRPVYSAKVARYTVTAVSGTVQNGSLFEFDTQATVIADEAPEGQKFESWRVNGIAVSYDASYSFYVTGNVTLTAFYVDEAAVIEKTPAARIDEAVLVNEETGRISFVSQLINLEEDFGNLVEFGFLFKKSDTEPAVDELELGAAGVVQAKCSKITRTGQSLYNKKALSGETWYARVYMVYEDESGNLITVYSDNIVSGTMPE